MMRMMTITYCLGLTLSIFSADNFFSKDSFNQEVLNLDYFLGNIYVLSIFNVSESFFSQDPAMVVNSYTVEKPVFINRVQFSNEIMEVVSTKTRTIDIRCQEVMHIFDCAFAEIKKEQGVKVIDPVFIICSYVSNAINKESILEKSVNCHYMSKFLNQDQGRCAFFAQVYRTYASLKVINPWDMMQKLIKQEFIQFFNQVRKRDSSY